MTETLKQILLTPFKEIKMDEDNAEFLTDVSRGNGQVQRIKPMRLNDSPTTPRPFDEACALWNALESIQHVIDLDGKRGPRFMLPSSIAMLKAAKEVLSEEFARTPSPKDDTERF